jgi:hypothetical protein
MTPAWGIMIDEETNIAINQQLGICVSTNEFCKFQLT